MVCLSHRHRSCADAVMEHRSPWQASQRGTSSSSGDRTPGDSSTGSSSGCSPELQAMLRQELQSYRTDHTADPAKLCAYCRSQLVDWMARAAHSTELQLDHGTLHLAVDLLDRFLSAVPSVRCSAGQLVGAACLWLASKYEEVNSCSMGDLTWLTCGSWTPQQLRDTERVILPLLDWRLALPTAGSFHSQLLAETDAGTDAPQRYLSAYLLELSLLCDDLLTVLPSCRASASLYLARLMLGFERSSWDSCDGGYAAASSYRERDLQPVAESIAYMHWLVSQNGSSSKLTGSREHFSGEASWGVATIAPVCLDLALAANNIPKLLARHRCSRPDHLWQQQPCDWQPQQQANCWSWQHHQQQPCDLQPQQEANPWQQHQQQYASWAWCQQHPHQQLASWMQLHQEQQQQAHTYWASQHSLAPWAQQQQQQQPQLQPYWYRQDQQHQLQLYWDSQQQQQQQQQAYKPPRQWETQQQQYQQASSPGRQRHVPHPYPMQAGQQQQQLTSYAAAGYAVCWPQHCYHRPTWMAAAAAASPAPYTPSQLEAPGGSGPLPPQPAPPACVDEVILALCKAAGSWTALTRQVSYSC